MKALNSYKTYRSICNDMAKEGFNEITGTFFCQRKGKDYFVRYDDIGFNRNTNEFSCAINEIGDFTCNNHELAKYWPYVIKAGLLLDKYKFVRCSTTERQPTELNEGLLANGFVPTGEVKSKHGRYMVYMWEWWKE